MFGVYMHVLSSTICQKLSAAAVALNTSACRVVRINMARIASESISHRICIAGDHGPESSNLGHSSQGKNNFWRSHPPTFGTGSCSPAAAAARAPPPFIHLRRRTLHYDISRSVSSQLPSPHHDIDLCLVPAFHSTPSRTSALQNVPPISTPLPYYNAHHRILQRYRDSSILPTPNPTYPCPSYQIPHLPRPPA